MYILPFNGTRWFTEKWKPNENFCRNHLAACVVWCEYRSTSFLLLSSDSSLQWMLIIGIRWVCVIGSLWLGVERVLPSTCAAVGGHTVHNFLDVTTNYLLNPWSTLVSFGETPQQIHPGTCRPGLHAPDHCFKLRVKTGTLAISEKWKLVEIF